MSSGPSVDLTPIVRLYEEGLAKHGITPPALGWRDAASHALRFKKLASVLEERSGTVAVNDLGCGYGAFYEYLVSQGVSLSHFRGYDISARMLAHARERIPLGEFIQRDVLDQPADYSFACGIFNVKLEQSESAWLAHVERILENLNRFSLAGFAFNILSTYVEFREPQLFYGDPVYFFDLCKRRYSRKVALFHDYPLFEWTIHVVK